MIRPDEIYDDVLVGEGESGLVSRDRTEDGLYVVDWDRGRVARIDFESGDTSRITTIRKAQLDGLIVLPDGSLLVSSWGAHAIYRVSLDGADAVVLDGLLSPADIGYDEKRDLVLIPLFLANRLLVLPLP